MGILESIFGIEDKNKKQQEKLIRRFHRGEFHPDEYSREDAEWYKKNKYGDKYDPNYEKKRQERMKKKYGKDYIEDYENKIWHMKF